MSDSLDSPHSFYQLEGNALTIKVTRAPIGVLAVYFIVSFVLLFGPIITIISSIIATGRAIYPNPFVWAILIVIGFFALRTFLWNAYGRDTFRFSGDTLEYQADFRYFKGPLKSYPILEELLFEKEIVGYEDDRNYRLVIRSMESTIAGGAKIPEAEMDELILLLQRNQSKGTLGLS